MNLQTLQTGERIEYSDRERIQIVAAKITAEVSRERHTETGRLKYHGNEPSLDGPYSTVLIESCPVG